MIGLVHERGMLASGARHAVGMAVVRHSQARSVSILRPQEAAQAT